MAMFVQQDPQASTGLQSGAMPTYAPDPIVKEDQHRRSSLDSRLAQMNKLRIFTGGTTVSTFLQCGMDTSACLAQDSVASICPTGIITNDVACRCTGHSVCSASLRHSWWTGEAAECSEHVAGSWLVRLFMLLLEL